MGKEFQASLSSTVRWGVICIPAILPLWGLTWWAGALEGECVMETSQTSVLASGGGEVSCPWKGEGLTYAMVSHCAGPCFLGNLNPLQRAGFN